MNEKPREPLDHALTRAVTPHELREDGDQDPPYFTDRDFNDENDARRVPKECPPVRSAADVRAYT